MYFPLSSSNFQFDCILQLSWGSNGNIIYVQGTRKLLVRLTTCLIAFCKELSTSVRSIELSVGSFLNIIATSGSGYALCRRLIATPSKKSYIVSLTCSLQAKLSVSTTSVNFLHLKYYRMTIATYKFIGSRALLLAHRVRSQTALRW